MENNDSASNIVIFREFVLRETGLFFPNERLQEIERNFYLILKGQP